MKQMKILTVIWAMLAAGLSTVFGQLTTADIAALRERGIREGWTFTVGENSATRRSLKELCGAVEPSDWRTKARFDPCTPRLEELPSSFDWCTQGGCTPVRNQEGTCGSCWAFATVGALECNIKIKDGVEEDLSEQWLVSCNTNGMGCGGGWFAHDYHQGTASDLCGGNGAVLEASFPYQASNVLCNCNMPCNGHYLHAYWIDDWAYIGPTNGIPSTEEIKQAIIDHGPVSVTVMVGTDFQAYSNGVFNASDPSATNSHLVVLVGWDDNDGNGYWILRNSWGAKWGEEGYMRIRYNCSNVGYKACYVDYVAADKLQVIPSGGFVSSGFVGGTFSPGSINYTLTNRSAAALSWGVTNTQSWLHVNPSSGTLETNATAIVAVSISNDVANGLSAGDHADIVTFTNFTSGGAAARPVYLTVKAYGILSVTPPTGFMPIGPVGGPFDPSNQVYTLANSGCASLDWAASKSQDWVSLSATSGSLAGGSSTDVTVSINSYANSLECSNYADLVIFTNTTNGAGSTTRDVALTVSTPGVLVVTPTDGLNSTGYHGGPFSPSSQVYTLTNSGCTSLVWAASKSQSWVSLSATSGSLAGGSSTDVTVSINTNANNLTCSNYADLVTFTNTTNGEGSTTRGVSLTVKPDGMLSVTPATGLMCTGWVGGPFTNCSQVYTLTNSGCASLVWAASKTQSWVSLSATSGSLAGGSSATVTVSINSYANSLSCGSYTDLVTFTNTTNGEGSTTRGVSLTVNANGILSVTPATGLMSSGPVGGPFSPSSQVYTLTNSGCVSLDWAASTNQACTSQAWLSLSATNGALAGGSSTNVTVLINTNANTLPVGIYSGPVTFTNLTNGAGTTNRMVKLTVTFVPIPPVPFYCPCTTFVIGWGYNSSGQTNPPPGLSNVVAIAAGGSHSLALNSDGTVVGWGNTSYGQTNVPVGLSDVVAIAAGGYHSLALKSDGIVVGWGYNDDYGQATPPTGLSCVVAIAAGGSHSLALKSDGTIVAWGAGTNNLGSEPYYGQSIIPSGLTNVVAIAAGDYHSLALKSDGTVVGWGYNHYGQTNVPPGLTNVVVIAAGDYHSLALKSDGTVVGWGYNSSGQTNIPPGLSCVVAIAAGGSHSLALNSDGTVVGWGNNWDLDRENWYGQATPPAGLSSVVAIAAGGWHSLALQCPYIKFPTGTTFFWINPAGGSWTNSTHWLGGTIAGGAGNTADFSTLNLTDDVTVTLDGARTIGNLAFGDAPPDHNWTLNTGAGGPVTLAKMIGCAWPTISVDNEIATINVDVAGTNGLAKTGAGTLVLGGTNNSWSGGTMISDGLMQIGNGGTGSIGTGTIINNASLSFVAANNISVSDAIVGSGSLTKTGVGVLTLRGANTYSGPTTVSNGVVVLGSPYAGSTNYGFSTPSLNVWTIVANNALVFSNGTNFAIGALAGPGNLGLTNTTGSGVTLHINSAPCLNTTFSGNLTGSGGMVIKEGDGVLMLSGTNTYTGGTTIAQGVLGFGSSDAVPTTGTLAISNGALVGLFFTGIQTAINHVSPSTAGAIAISAASANEDVNFNSGPGITNVWMVAAETLTYGGIYTPFTNSSSSTNAYRLGAGGIYTDTPCLAGSSAVAGVTLTYTNVMVDLGHSTKLEIGPFGGTVALFGPRVDISGSNIWTNCDVVVTNPVLVTNGFVIVTNSYSGGTFIYAPSTLYIAGDRNLGSAGGGVTLSNASLEATNSFTLNNRAVTLLNSGTFNIDPVSTLTITNVISGTGPLTKYGAGLLVLGTNNSFTDGTVINEGVLAYGNSNAVPNDSSVMVNAGAAVGFIFSNIQSVLSAVVAGKQTNTGGVALFATNANENISFGPIPPGADLWRMSLVAAEDVTYGGTYTPYNGGAGGGVYYRLGAMTGVTLTYPNSIVDLNGPSSLVIGGFNGGFNGTVFLAGNNTYTGANASEGFGATTIKGGTVYITNDAALGAGGDGNNLNVGGLVISNATLRTTNTITLNNRLVGLMGNATIDVLPGSILIITNVIQYLGTTNLPYVTDISLTKTGSGLLILTGTNNVPAGTTKIDVYINGGVLRAASGVGINFFPPTDTGTESNSNVYIDAGVWEVTSGLLTNRVTTLQGSGGLAFGNGGSGSGLSAHDRTLVVWLGTDATATHTNNPSNVSTQQWGSGNFNPTVLILNENTANTNLTWRNHIDLNAGVSNVTTRTIAVNAANPLVTRIFGRIMNNAPFSVGGLTKMGVGTLELETNNTYNGATTINHGTLKLQGAGSITNSMFIVVGVNAASNAYFDVSGVTGGPYTIGGATSQALAGFGSVIGNVTLANAATLAPGDTATTTNYYIGCGTNTVTNTVAVLTNGVGTLTFSNNLTVASTNTLIYDLGTNSDLAVVGGNLTVGGTLNVRDSGGFTNTTYTLFTYGGTLTYNGVTTNVVPNTNWTYTINTDTVSQVKLVVTAPCTPPWASFNATPTLGPAPLSVTLTDTTTGTVPLTLYWNLGNGSTITGGGVQITNTYTSAGAYTVQLIASNACGWSTNTQPVTVIDPYTWWASNYFGCIGCAQAAGTNDFDGDGMSNTNEFLAGTNPTNSLSALRIVSVVRQTTDVVITWTTVTNKSYRVQTNAPPVSGSYTNNFADFSPVIPMPSSGGESTTNYTDVGGATNAPSRFYRIRLVP